MLNPVSTGINNWPQAGLPARYVTKPTRSTQPYIPPGSLYWVPALMSHSMFHLSIFPPINHPLCLPLHTLLSLFYGAIAVPSVTRCRCRRCSRRCRGHRCAGGVRRRATVATPGEWACGGSQWRMGPTFFKCFKLMSVCKYVIGWGKGRNVTSARWKVILCDPMAVRLAADCYTCLPLYIYIHRQTDRQTNGHTHHTTPLPNRVIVINNINTQDVGYERRANFLCGHTMTISLLIMYCGVYITRMQGQSCGS